MKFKEECLNVINKSYIVLKKENEYNKKNISQLENISNLCEGNMYDYISKHKQSLARINECLSKNNLMSFNDLISKYSSTQTDLYRVKASDFEIGKKYRTTTICSLAKNYNHLLGMYYVENDEPFVVLKATTDGNGVYPNEWIEEGNILKYYLRADKKDYSNDVLRFGPNRIIKEKYDSKEELNILCFGRDNDNSLFIFYGVFSVIDFVFDKTGIWIKLQKKYSKFDSNKFSKEQQEYKEDLESLEKTNEVSYDDATQYKEFKREAPKPVFENGKTKYKRNPIVTKKALINSKFQCENDKAITFTGEATNCNYVEGHHLIPICYQGDFKYDIDITANIVALCPKCHMLLHHAIFSQKKPIIKKIYEERKDRLKEFGIDISFDELLDYYR